VAAPGDRVFDPAVEFGQRGIGLLPELRQLLLKYPDARELALARIRHAKYFTADFLSGGYRIQTLIPPPDDEDVQ
jgi:hypothetical protein